MPRLTSKPKAMELETILERFGGDKSVAEKLSCGVSAISNWKVRGIPTGRKFDLLALAERAGLALAISDIEAVDRAIINKRAAAAEAVSDT